MTTRRLPGLLAITGLSIAVLTTGCNSTPPPVPPALTSAQMAENAFNTDQWESAARYYSQAIVQEGQFYDYYVKRGVCYKSLGKNDEAYADFIQASKLFPNDEGKSLFLAAQTCLAMDKNNEAIDALDQLLRRSPNHEKGNELRLQTLLTIALNDMKKGKYEDALKALDLHLAIAQPLTVQLAKAECLFLKAKTKEDWNDTVISIKTVLPKLSKDELSWRKFQKMYVQTLFYQRKAKDSKTAFNTYLTVCGTTSMSADDIFWAGLIAKVNLDNKTQQQYWSRISASYLKKQLKSLRK